ncbi:Sec-independent protein translocase protein TatB [uncultured Nevskia sp.]|uniref:Sec-independent protein translocase protein TatB n=1 Tax=uncultured Nevskia sp. TaxID=228950 RepID=UPI0025FED652|nr:Sec-independent protein translocase protein TatB [uncultured Nevskia sp.]
MLDISFSELLLCFLVALVVLGPEKLPRVARGIGRWTGQAKAYMRNLSAELDRESHASELKQQMADARRIFDEESTAMKREFHGAAEQGRNAMSDSLPAADTTPTHSETPVTHIPAPAPPRAADAPSFSESKTPDKHV